MISSPLSFAFSSSSAEISSGKTLVDSIVVVFSLFVADVEAVEFFRFKSRCQNGTYFGCPSNSLSDAGGPEK
jgi:hypothetical protein